MVVVVVVVVVAALVAVLVLNPDILTPPRSTSIYHLLTPARRQPPKTLLRPTTHHSLLTTHLRGGVPPQLEARHATVCIFTTASTVALAPGQPRCAHASVFGACSHAHWLGFTSVVRNAALLYSLWRPPAAMSTGRGGGLVALRTLRR